MKNVRIYSESVGDLYQEGDANSHIVFHLRLKDDLTVDRQLESFGYTVEYSDERKGYSKYPFIASYDSKSDFVFLDFGETDPGHYKVNINKMEPKVGGYFTYYYPDAEYTYRILRITDL